MDWRLWWKRPGRSRSCEAEDGPAHHPAWGFSLDEVKLAYEALLDTGDAADAVQRVLRLRQEDVPAELLDGGERSLPSEERFYKTGYWRMMVGRYLFAGSQFCRGRNVLDVCCGLGWGAFLVSRYARQVTAFDIDTACVEFAQKTWPEPNIRWLCSDALDRQTLAGERFDAALAMEAVEHFTAADGERLVALMAERLRKDGIFIGTSAFPASREEAVRLTAHNPHHPHIFTEQEFLALLRRHFSRAAIIGNWMFLALR